MGGILSRLRTIQPFAEYDHDYEDDYNNDDDYDFVDVLRKGALGWNPVSSAYHSTFVEYDHDYDDDCDYVVISRKERLG